MIMSRGHVAKIRDGKSDKKFSKNSENNNHKIIYSYSRDTMDQEKFVKDSRRDFDLNDEEGDEGCIEYLRKEQNLNDDAIYDYITELVVLIRRSANEYNGREGLLG